MSKAKRVNLTCLVDALSRFQEIPKEAGQEYWLAVDTMTHRLKKMETKEKGLTVVAPKVKDINEQWVMVKLTAVLYVLKDGRKFLTWEFEI